MNEFLQAASMVICRPANNREDGAQIETLLIRRARGLVLGGYDAFISGRTDRADEKCAQAHGINTTLFTAIRETFEETGILLSHGPTLDPQTKNEIREVLMADKIKFGRMLREMGHALRPEDFLPLGTLHTPPYTPQRFAADQYAFWMSEDQKIIPLKEEVESVQWISPKKALQSFAEGKLRMAFPVLEILRTLAETDFPSQNDSQNNSQNDSGKTPLKINTPVHREMGEIATGVRIISLRSETLLPATHTNTYLLGESELILVDPGSSYKDQQDELSKWLHELISRGATLKEIWLTHHHPDHIGGVNRLREEFGVPVAAHPKTREILKDSVITDRDLDDRVVTLDAESTMPSRWRSIFTPGHAPGHLVFYEETLKTLISGDLILGFGTPVIAPPRGNMKDYFESLERLLEIDIDLILPAHGPPIGAPHEKIREYLEHRKMRESSIKEKLSTAPPTQSFDATGSTINELLGLVYPDLEVYLHDFAKMTILAHLLKLVEDGEVEKKDERYYISA